MSIEIIGERDVLKALEQVGITAAEDKKTMVLGTATIIQQEMIRRSPSDRLKKEIITEILEETETTIAVGVGPMKKGRAWFAHIIEFGALPHHIFPDQAKALQVRPDVYRAAVYDHPGVEPQPFMRPAYDENIDRAIDEATERVKKLLGL